MVSGRRNCSPGGLATICPATRRTMPEIWTEGINKEAGIFEIKFIKLTSDESLRMVFQEYKKTASVSLERITHGAPDNRLAYSDTRMFMN